MFSLFAFVAMVLVSVDAFGVRASLPDYLERCSQSDPKLNECFLRSGNRAIPQLVKGDARYNIPSMLPYKIKEVIIRNDEELKFILKNVQVYGLQNAKVRGINVNFNDASLVQNITMSRLIFLGDYDLAGKVLNEYVEGKGKANITIVNGIYKTKMYFRTENNHAVPYGSYTNYKPQIVIYDFENLYNGHHFRGYQTNIYLNNNWKAVNKLFERETAKQMNKFVTDLYRRITAIAPVSELYLP